MNQTPAKNSPHYAACKVGDASFTIGAEAGNAINVAIQLKNDRGQDVYESCHVFGYLSSNADGSTIVGTAPNSGIAIGTDGLMIEVISDKAFHLISEADGDIDITFSESGVATFYLVLCMPSGHLKISGPITFA